MDKKKLDKIKAVSLEKMEAAFKELDVSDSEAQEYVQSEAAKSKKKVDKKHIKATKKFAKLEDRWIKRGEKDIDKDLDKSLKTMNKTYGPLGPPKL